MSYRALVVGAGNAGKAHAEALVSIGIDVVGPLSGTAAVADPAPLRDPAVDVVYVTTANDLHPRSWRRSPAAMLKPSSRSSASCGRPPPRSRWR